MEGGGVDSADGGRLLYPPTKTTTTTLGHIIKENGTSTLRRSALLSSDAYSGGMVLL